MPLREMLIVIALLFIFGGLCPAIQSTYGLIYAGGQQTFQGIVAYMQLTHGVLVLPASAVVRGPSTHQAEPVSAEKTRDDKRR